MTGSTEIKKALCVWCKGECGVLVHVKDGRLIKAEEDPDFPTKVWPATRGCVRLKAAAEWFYHPDRLSFPLKRAGAKGEGKWEKISWDQALDEIAQRLSAAKEKHGAESIAFTTGTTYKGDHSLAGRFFTLLGTSLNRASAGSICFWPRAMAANALTGWFPHFSVKPSTKCILVIGQEPVVSRPGPALTIREARKNGAKLIVVDPRRTRSAADADLWLQLRPGTDTALMLGMINVIITEGLYDRPFVENWCHGFEELRERIAQYPPEWAARVSDVPVEKIGEAARIYAANRPGCILEGVTLEQVEDTFDALHARWILAALTGNIDIEGGEEQVGPHRRIISYGDLEPRAVPAPEQIKKQIGSERFKFLSYPGQKLILENLRKVWWGSPLAVSLAHGPSVMRTIISGKPYPVRALWSMGNNILATQPNVKLLYRALKALDLYVVVDMWMTPSACLADYVLPCASWLERPILYDFNGYDRWMKAGEAALPAAVPGKYDRKFDAEIFRELGLRLGQEKYWPWKTLEEYYDMQLKPTGLSHEAYVREVRCELKTPQYKKYETAGFATPTGKVELYSTIMEKLGYDPLPSYHEPSETPAANPELAKEYPLTLITGGRVREFYHSDFRQIESVRKRHPYPLLQIHPDTAAGLGIAEGDWAWIETIRGRVRQKAAITADIRPDVVHAEHGWWYPELPAEEPWLHGIWESNIGVVLNDDPEVCDRRTGGWPLKTALCKVYRVKTYEDSLEKQVSAT